MDLPIGVSQSILLGFLLHGEYFLIKSALTILNFKRNLLIKSHNLEDILNLFKDIDISYTQFVKLSSLNRYSEKMDLSLRKMSTHNFKDLKLN
jgi:hypothetical protein